MPTDDQTPLSPRRPQGRWRPGNGLVLGIAAFVLCTLLGQRVFYKTDGIDLLWLLHEDQLQHPWHVGYLPLLAALRWCLEWTGMSLLRLGEVFSALGVAVAVGTLHRAMVLLGSDRRTALLAALLLLCNPGTLLFGSVVEFHGPLLGATGVAMWWVAVQSAAPRALGMAALGILTHAAFLLHSTGLFLPALLLPWFLALRRRHAPAEWRRDLALAALAGAVHVLLFLVLPRLFTGFYGDYADLGTAFAREASIGRPQSIAWAPTILVQEWLIPLLPLSLAVLAAACRRALRLEMLALAIGLLPFWYVCVRQLVFEPEQGAYLLPLLPLCARLTTLALPVRALWVLVLFSAVFGVAMVCDHEARQLGAQTAWTGAARQAAQGAPLCVVADTHAELGHALATLVPGDFPREAGEFLYVRRLATMPRELLAEEHLQGVVAFLGALMAEGRAVVMSANTLRALEDPAAQSLDEKITLQVRPSSEQSGPLYVERLRVAFDFVPKDGDFFRLQPKGQ